MKKQVPNWFGRGEEIKKDQVSKEDRTIETLTELIAYGIISHENSHMGIFSVA